MDHVSDPTAGKDFTQCIDEAAASVRSRLPEHYQSPAVGIICGSGLSKLGARLENAVDIPFNSIPFFPRASVQGHGTSLLVGMMNGVVTAVMTGRIHFYEGHSLQATTIPVRLLTRLGIKLLLATNAAGGVNPAFRPGDIMVITDHISFLSMSGQNCLRGANLDSFGPRFPSVTEAYLRKSKQLITEAAAQAGIDTSIIREGTYCQVSGPSYETPAELRFINMIGGSAVGMSTVNEIVCAAHGGVKVVAMSLITNACVLNRSEDEGGYAGPTHEEVLETSKHRSAEMENLVYFLVPKLVV